MMKRMEKARKKAANIIDNDDLGSREKVTEIKKLYKKAAAGKLAILTRFSVHELLTMLTGLLLYSLED